RDRGLARIALDEVGEKGDGLRSEERRLLAPFHAHGVVLRTELRGERLQCFLVGSGAREGDRGKDERDRDGTQRSGQVKFDHRAWTSVSGGRFDGGGVSFT